MVGLLRKMLRRKSVEGIEQTSLSRCLGVCDLTVMGIGSMVGSGIYIMTGIAAKEQAGPGIVLCFVLAAIVVVPIMMCYTELAARFHKTGSGYLYIYLTMGELPAVILGFSTLIMIVMGGAMNARAWSAYLDSLFMGSISNFTETHLAYWDSRPPLAEYPDILAAALMLLATAVVACGATCSARFTGLFAILNIFVLLFTSIVGFVYADISNWTSSETGGFLPYGWSGLVKGAAACFWALSGFEVISMAVEETQNVKRNIPLATGLVMVTVTLLYVTTSAALTLMISYTELDIKAPLPMAFAVRGIHWGRYVVAIGPLCGLTSTIILSVYGFARMAYALSDDGLFFEIFGRVSGYSQVPLFSTVVGGVLMASVALFLDLAELIAFSVNLSLIGYSLVCSCVIVLRYRSSTHTLLTEEDSTFEMAPSACSQDSPFELAPAVAPLDSNYDLHASAASQDSILDIPSAAASSNSSFELLPSPNLFDPVLDDNKLKEASHFTHLRSEPGQIKEQYRCIHKVLPCANWTSIAIVVVVVCVCVMGLLFVYGEQYVHEGAWWTILLLALASLLVSLTVISMHFYQQNITQIQVKMPCVPLLPCIALSACIFLLLANSTLSGWVGTACLLAASLIIYFSYGIRYSKLNDAGRPRERVAYDESRERLLDADEDSSHSD